MGSRELDSGRAAPLKMRIAAVQKSNTSPRSHSYCT